MVSSEALLGFFILCLVIEATPGPNMTYLAVLTIGVGRRAGLATVAGIGLGLLLVGMASAFGLAALLDAYPLVYQLLRWAGVAYLLWIAAITWRGEKETSPDLVARVNSDVRFFRRGLVINLLNPKAAVFYVSMLPGFVTAEGDMMAQTLLLTGISVFIATFAHLMIVLAAGSLAPLLASPVRFRTLRRWLALALGAIALWFAYSAA